MNTLILIISKIFLFIAIILTFIINSHTYAYEGHKIASILWVNTSAEYVALCHQAYNIAKIQLDAILTKPKKSNKPYAIVVDCDNTILSDVSFQAYLETQNKKYSLNDWHQWIEAYVPSPVPGSLEFLQYAHKNNCDIFYVSNRNSEKEYDTTKSHLLKYNFPCVDKMHLLLKTHSSDKQIRMNLISKSHNIILYIGDSLDDLPIQTKGLPISDRKKRALNFKNDYGVKYIVLPNPMYGGWETAISKSDNVNQEDLLGAWKPLK